MLGIFYKWMSNFATERPRTTFLWTKAMVLYDNYCERKIHSALKSIFRPTDHIGVKLFFEVYVFKKKVPKIVKTTKKLIGLHTSLPILKKASENLVKSETHKNISALDGKSKLFFRSLLMQLSRVSKDHKNYETSKNT